MQGKIIGQGGRPLICTPLIGKTGEALLAEIAQIAAKQPDVIEWRADYFDGLSSARQTVDTANLLKRASDGATMIFTIRSVKEGGQEIPLTENEVVGSQ